MEKAHHEALLLGDLMPFRWDPHRSGVEDDKVWWARGLSLHSILNEGVHNSGAPSPIQSNREDRQPEYLRNENLHYSKHSRPNSKSNPIRSL